MKYPKIIKWMCECGNIVISDVKRNENNGKFYTDFYCLKCQERDPLNMLIVQEVSTEEIIRL